MYYNTMVNLVEVLAVPIFLGTHNMAEHVSIEPGNFLKYNYVSVSH